MSAVEVELDMSGVRAILKSDGVRSVLMSECQAAAGRCNSLVSWHSQMTADAYGAAVQDGGFTAIGIVGMRRLGHDGKAVAYENAAHNTLLKGCGW